MLFNVLFVIAYINCLSPPYGYFVFNKAVVIDILLVNFLLINSKAYFLLSSIYIIALGNNFSKISVPLIILSVDLSNAL